MCANDVHCLNKNVSEGIETIVNILIQFVHPEQNKSRVRCTRLHALLGRPEIPFA